MRKRKYVSLYESVTLDNESTLSSHINSEILDFDQYENDFLYKKQNGFTDETELGHENLLYQWPPNPRCHNIVSTSQIQFSQSNINLQRLADLYAFTTYDRKRFAAITIRLANPHCTCLLFGSGKLVITGSTSYNACILAAHEITRLLRKSNPHHRFEVISCIIQNIVAHVELPPKTKVNLEQLYYHFCECSTFQKTVFPGLVLRLPKSPIVLLIFASGRIVCTGGRSYNDIYWGFKAIFDLLKPFIKLDPSVEACLQQNDL